MDLITCTQTTVAENTDPKPIILRFHEAQDRGIFGVPDHLIVATNVQNFIFRTISCTRKKSESIRCLELGESCRCKKIFFYNAWSTPETSYFKLPNAFRFLYVDFSLFFPLSSRIRSGVCESFCTSRLPGMGPLPHQADRGIPSPCP